MRAGCTVDTTVDAVTEAVVTLGDVVMKELVVAAGPNVISTELVAVSVESSVAVSSGSELVSTESVGIAEEESSVAVVILVG